VAEALLAAGAGPFSAPPLVASVARARRDAPLRLLIAGCAQGSALGGSRLHDWRVWRAVATYV
jgi:hypothetical protein